MDFYIYIADGGYIVHIYEGTGDNLLREDIEEGYRDYINYDAYVLAEEIMCEDGGMVLTKTLVSEITDEDAVRLVLEEMGYSGGFPQWMMLADARR